MKKTSFILLLLFVFAICANAESINVAPVKILDYQAGGSSAPLKIYSSETDSLTAAISKIGKSAAKLIVNEDTTISAPVTIPANVILEFRNDAVIRKIGKGTLTLAGTGIANATERKAKFAGFAVGDIRWTGENYPKEITTEIFDTNNDSLSDRLGILNSAFDDAQSLKVILYPRTITSVVNLKDRIHLHFTAGIYENTFLDQTVSPAPPLIPFNYGNYFTITADAGNVIKTSVNEISGQLIAPFDLNAQLTAVYISGLHIIGTRKQENAKSSLIQIGNVRHAKVSDIIIEKVKEYPILVGGNGSATTYAEFVTVENCKFIDNPTQNLSLVNGRNITFRNNKFYFTKDLAQAGVGGGTISVVDVEPNAYGDYVENFTFENNEFYSQELSQGYVDRLSVPNLTQTQINLINNSRITLYGVVVQAASSKYVSGVTIKNNSFYGRYIDYAESDLGQLQIPIMLSGVQDFAIQNNKVTAASSDAVRIALSRDGSVNNNNFLDVGGTVLLSAAANVNVSENTANRSGTPADVQHEAREEEYEYQVFARNSQLTIATDSFGGGFRAYRFNNLKFKFNAQIYEVADVDPRSPNQKINLKTGVSAAAPPTNKFSAADAEANGVITFPVAHGYTSGERVTATTSAKMPAPLMQDGIYYVQPVNDTQIYLSKTYYGAMDGFVGEKPSTRLIESYSGGSGDVLLTGYNFNVKTVLPNYVDAAKDTITLPSPHGYTTGAAARLAPYDAKNSIPSGLPLNGGTFFIINISPKVLKIAFSEADAKAGKAIDLTSKGAGRIVFTPLIFTRFSSNTYKNNKFDVPISLEPTGKSVIFSPSKDYRRDGTVSINPAEIKANSTQSQIFTLNGARVGDTLILNGPGTGLSSGVTKLNAWVSADNKITVVFQNPNSSSADQSAQTWNYTIFR